MPVESGSPEKKRNYAFKKIAELEATNSATANFFGRVVQIKPARQTRGSDWCMSLVVVDDSLIDDSNRGVAIAYNGTTLDGMMVMIFKAHQADFPKVESIGDIVEFRRFKIQYHNGNKQALSSHYSAFTVFRKDSENNWISIPSGNITTNERERITAIDDLFINAEGVTSNTTRVVGIPIDAPGNNDTSTLMKRPTLLVKDIRPSVFFRGVYKIVKLGDSPREDCFGMFVTDYTENELAHRSTASLGLPEYLSDCLLEVTLWDNFAEDAREIKFRPGDYVYLDNLTGKMIRRDDGTSYLVVALHGDMNPKKTFLARIKPESPSGGAVIKRIEEQLFKLKQVKNIQEDALIAAVQQATAVNAIVTAVDIYDNNENNINITTSATVSTTTTNTATVAEQVMAQANVETNRTDPSNVLTRFNPRSILNRPVLSNTVIEGENIPITNILSIRAFGETNAKFCVKARVNSAFPNNITKYTRYLCNKCSRTSEIDAVKATGHCSTCNQEIKNGRLIWTFGLIIEDATGDLPVILAEGDAEHFMGGLMAVDLSLERNDDTSDRIGEIFASLTAPGKECLFCLKSYSIDTTGPSHMRYRIFNTRICH